VVQNSSYKLKLWSLVVKEEKWKTEKLLNILADFDQLNNVWNWGQCSTMFREFWIENTRIHQNVCYVMFGWSSNLYSPSMFPLIFQSLCAQKISFVQHFTMSHLFLEWNVWNMWKNIFGRTSMCAQSFTCIGLISPLVRTHSLEGTVLSM